MPDEKFFALDHVKAMQEDVKPWPEQGYPSVVLITERWLNHWKKRKRSACSSSSITKPPTCSWEPAEAFPTMRQGGTAIPLERARKTYRGCLSS